MLSSRASRGTKSVSMHSLQAWGRAGSLKLRQEGESWNIDVAFHGVRTQRPYPPCSRKASSNFKTSKTSRLSSDINTSRCPVLAIGSPPEYGFHFGQECTLWL